MDLNIKKLLLPKSRLFIQQVWYLTAHGTVKGGKEECNAAEGYF
jgi:hypothetical protein